jgi:uncharacterized protein YeaC (DUF1315 family)
MNYKETIDSITPQIYQRLVRAVELGKWPDNKVVTPAQREHAMQAIIAWGERHLEEQDRVGYVPKKPDTAGPCDTSLENPLKWQE